MVLETRWSWIITDNGIEVFDYRRSPDRIRPSVSMKKVLGWRMAFDSPWGRNRKLQRGELTASFSIKKDEQRIEESTEKVQSVTLSTNVTARA